MLTVHHLGKSQSERIIWLCEELGIPYALKRYDRDDRTMLAPAEYRALHPLGAAPVITDGELVLAESGAIMQFIIAKWGEGRFSLPPDHADYADYLYWFHFANGTLQPAVMRVMTLSGDGMSADSPLRLGLIARRDRALSAVNSRLEAAPYLAGPEFTAADMMIIFTLTTMRHFAPFELNCYPHIAAYLRRIAARPSYRAAMEKGDPGMALLLG